MPEELTEMQKALNTLINECNAGVEGCGNCSIESACDTLGIYVILFRDLRGY